MDRTSREDSEERDFRDTVGLEVSKTCHSFGNHDAQIFVFYMPVGPINAVLRRAMIGHVVADLEPERLAGRSARHAQHSQEVKINYSFPACASHIRLGMTGFSKIPTFYT